MIRSQLLTLILVLALVQPRLTGADLLSVLEEVETSINERTTSGATRRVEDSLSSPAIVKSYSQEDLKHYHSLIDFFRIVPGMAVDQGRRNYQYIQVRGNNHQIHNNKILVLINGHKIADEIGPETHLDLVPIESIRRLEIVRGPGSVLYGANAFAALINIHTFDALSFKKNRVSMTLGNDNQKTGFVDWKETDQAGLKLYFAYKYSDEKGANRPAAENLINGQGITAPWILPGPPKDKNLNPLPNDHRFVFSELSDYKLNNQGNNFLGVLHSGDLRITLGRADLSRNLSYDFRDDSQHVGIQSFYDYIGGDYEKQFENRLSWKIRGKIARARVLTSEKGFDNLDPANPAFQAVSNSLAHDLEMQWTYRPNSKMDWIFGGISERTRYDRSLDLTFINGFQLGFPLTPNTNTHTNGIYLQGTYRLNDRLELLAAFRRNHNSHFGTTHTPKVALSYKIGEGEYFKAVHGKSFRYASGHEAFTFIPDSLNPNPLLKPEEVESFELDYIRSMDEGRKTFELTYFRLKIDDFIFQNDRIDLHENAGSLISEGLEIDLSTHLNDEFKLWFNATVMDMKGETYVSDAGIADPFGRERFGDFTQSTLKRFGAIGFDFDASERWGIHWASRYRGSQHHRFDSRYGYKPQGSYFLHDLGLEYRHSSDREMRLDIYNLAEKVYGPIDYDIQSTKVQSYPRGRSIRLTYTIKF
jgi:outer membrane receptor protein involved in Fe transport